MPPELRAGIQHYWPEGEWENAAAISNLESGWRLAARAYVTDPLPGNSPEDSRGPFQVNIYVHTWAEANRLLRDWDYSSWAGHEVWQRAGGSWRPWFYSARTLRLL